MSVATCILLGSPEPNFPAALKKGQPLFLGDLSIARVVPGNSFPFNRLTYQVLGLGANPKRLKLAQKTKIEILVNRKFLHKHLAVSSPFSLSRVCEFGVEVTRCK